MPDLPTIQGLRAAREIQAWNLTELSEAVRQCVADGVAIADYGQAYHGLGHAPPQPFAVLHTAPGIIEHYIADMTVRVRAATPLADLQRDLAEHHQWLPIDGVSPQATIGEIIAHNSSGSLRAGYGTMRDLLLGLRYIDAHGDEITVGGRTVKNVAGYDVTKFIIGSMNTFGLITECTLRTFAIPEHVVHVTVNHIQPNLLDEHGTSLMTCDAAPVAIEYRWDHTDVAPGLHITYSGSEQGCTAQLAALKKWLSNHADNQPDIAHTTDTTHQGNSARSSNTNVKIIVPAAITGRTIQWLCDASLASHDLSALPLHGIIEVQGEWSVDQAQRADQAITQHVQENGGLRVWMQRPDHTPTIAPFAPVQPDWTLLKRITQALDPKRLFNPKRTPWNE